MITKEAAEIIAILKEYVTDTSQYKGFNIIGTLTSQMYPETEGKCDGLVIVGKCNSTALKKLDTRYKSVVSVNWNSTNYEVDEILCDGCKVASTAVNYLISLGHKKTGYVGDCRPMLTTVKLPKEEMGKFALYLLSTG